MAAGNTIFGLRWTQLNYKDWAFARFTGYDHDFEYTGFTFASSEILLKPLNIIILELQVHSLTNFPLFILHISLVRSRSPFAFPKHEPSYPN